MRKLNSIILSLLLALSCVGMHVNAEEIQEETVIEETIDEVTAEEAVEQDLEVVEVNNELEEEVLIVEETTSEETNEEEPLLVEDPQEEIIEEEIVEEAPIEEVIEEVVEEKEIVKSEAKAEQLDAPADSEGDDTLLTEIYVKPTAKNSSEDGSKDNPVTSLDKAIELLNDNPDAKTIYVLDTLKLEGEVSLPEGVVLKRADNFWGNMISVLGGSTLTLKNIIIDGNSSVSGANSMINVAGELVINSGTVIQNHYNPGYYRYGAVFVGTSGSVTMNDGTVRNNVGGVGGGFTVYGTITLNGGSIENNKAQESNDRASGGGVCVLDNGIMHMNGGQIINNQSSWHGGGVGLGLNAVDSVDGNGPRFYMTGGLFDNNVSRNTGGGIFLQCKSIAEITGGTFTNNRSRGGMFGGGAIYVNGGYTNWQGSSFVNAKLYLYNVIISENSAGGNTGGGLASCPTTITNVNINDGGLITNNTANGSLNDVVINNAVTPVYGPAIAKVYVSSHALGGGDYNWRSISHTDVDDEYKRADRYYSVPRWSYFSIYSQPSEETVEKAKSLAKVFIQNNSAAGLGGGVGSNGDVYIGTPDTFSGKLKVSKTVEAEKEEEKTKEFTFIVTLDQYIKDGEYGDMVFENSIATFTLKDGESKLATGLPDGARYTVEEIEDDNYIVISNGEVGQFLDESVHKVVFTNIYKWITVEGKKTWVNDSEEDRPESITVRLYANGEEVDSCVVTAEDEWKYKFTDLDKYDEDFKEIEYTVSEDEVEKYTTAIDGYDITNTRKPEKVLVSKQDVAGEELVGASLEIYDVDNKLITSWVSGGNEKEIELLPGTYVLHEKEAPEGYEKVEDITFEVDRDGNVKLVKYDERQVRVESNKLVVIDYFTPETPDKPKPSIPPTPRTPSNPPKKPSVNTSDNTNSLLWFGLMIMSLGVAIITTRKLKEDK